MKINGYILAGGQSKRMGTDKGLIPIDGTTFAGKIAATLENVCETVVIVGARETYASLDRPILPDAVSGIGPLGGIMSALKHTDKEWNFIVSCDTPYISEALIAYLLEHAKASAQMVLPLHEERSHYLTALFHRDLLPDIIAAVESGDYSLRGLVERIETLEVPITRTLTFYSDRLFLNFNTPDDLQRYNP